VSPATCSAPLLPKRSSAYRLVATTTSDVPWFAGRDPEQGVGAAGVDGEIGSSSDSNASASTRSV
jgi:hypothetical protein